MTPQQKIKSDDYKNVQVKAEQNLMVSKKDQYKFLLENIDNSSIENIALLNDLIDTSSCLKDIIHYRAKRAAAFFEIKNWNDALVDIDFIEKYDKIDQSLEMVKWKSMVHQKMEGIHNDMKAHLDFTLLHNTDFMHLLTCINQENMQKYMQIRPTLDVLQKARSNIENHLKEINTNNIPPDSAQSRRRHRSNRQE